ncbi:hypothetical protein WN944_007173 [Citrus x changshan-huyou]|uniref:Uncharacterized protein n=1 Tax=Citrus x changshan-huyou TaxID=2935761 RepID=A0AAP0MRW7_9ROSI
MLGFTRSLIPEPENISQPFLLSSAYNSRHRSRYLNYQEALGSASSGKQFYSCFVNCCFKCKLKHIRVSDVPRHGSASIFILQGFVLFYKTNELVSSDDMSSSTDSDDDLIDLIALPIIMYQYLNYMVEESCSTDDDTSYGSTVVSAPQKKRQKVSKGVGVAQNSSRRAVVSTQVKKTELLSQGVGVGDAASLLVLYISWSWRVNSHESFHQCLLDNSPPSHPIFQAIHTPQNSSYSSVLQSYIRNLRFNTSSTPKPVLIVAAMHESHVQAAIKNN